MLSDWQLEAVGDAGIPLLAPGRWPMTAAELHRIAVDAFPESRTRAELWKRFEATRTALAGVARELWVGGSFVSTKLNPRDLDLLAVLRTDRIRIPRLRIPNEFVTNLAYAVGEALDVDLAMRSEADSRELKRWQEWIEFGKPWLRADHTRGRGIAVVPFASASSSSDLTPRE